MSRWSTPARCAVSMALPIFTAMRSTSGTGMLSRRYRSLRVAEQSSITRKGRPSADTLAWYTVRIAGCALSCAIRLASAWNICRTWVVDDLVQHHLDGDLTARHVLFVEEYVGESAGSQHVDIGEARQHRGLRRQTSGHDYLLSSVGPSILGRGPHSYSGFTPEGGPSGEPPRSGVVG